MKINKKFILIIKIKYNNKILKLKRKERKENLKLKCNNY
jgi:hypothetical protein